MRKFRFHIPGAIHIPISERYSHCAYTQKIVKMTKMMLSLGHEVYLYGAEGSDVSCTEFIQTHSLEDIKAAFGDGTDNELGYNWEKNGLDESKHSVNLKTILYPQFLAKCAEEVNKRKRVDDFLLLTFGAYYKAIDQCVGLQLTVEPGIGYTTSYSQFRAFESASLMNTTYGGELQGRMFRPSLFNRVIPNYFDPKDFEYKEEKQEYFLYMGRLTYAKGVTIAVKTAEALKTKLLIAGQGVETWEPETGHLKALEFDVTSPYIEYIGYADIERRKFLLSNAKAVFVPSLYNEPFGGINIEAQLSGTPVLATHNGAFPETIRHGETGYLCYTNDEFFKYASDEYLKKLDPKIIRKHAERYLIDNVKNEFQDWFDYLYNIVFNS